MAQQSNWYQRLAVVSLALAAASISFWLLVHFPGEFRIDDLDPDGYSYFAAFLVGTSGGLLAIAVAITQFVKRREVSRALKVAVLIGLPTLVWNVYILWMFISWLLYCADGPCH